MKAYRKIVSCLLLAIYGLVLLHNFVPHNHLKEVNPVLHQHEHDHSTAHHNHSDRDEQPVASLLDLFLSIIEGHTVLFNTDNNHFLAYQTGKKLCSIDVVIEYLPSQDFSWHHPPPQEINSIFLAPVFSLKEDGKFLYSPLRGPPVLG